jgi:hypothetical protein
MASSCEAAGNALGSKSEKRQIDSRAIVEDLAATLNRINRLTSIEPGGIKIWIFHQE